MISAKYDQGYIGDIPIKGKYRSLKAPWRSIIKGVDWFLSHTHWKLNNGENNSFWNGAWTEKSPLPNRGSLHFLIFRRVVLKTCGAQTLLIGSPTKKTFMEFRNSIVWNYMKYFLSAPDNNGGADALIWKLNSNYQFNVASIKKAIHANEQNDGIKINPIILQNL